MSDKIFQSITDLIDAEEAFIIRRELPKHRPDYALCNESGLAWMMGIKSKYVTNVYKLTKTEDGLKVLEVPLADLKKYYRQLEEV